MLVFKAVVFVKEGATALPELSKCHRLEDRQGKEHGKLWRLAISICWKDWFSLHVALLEDLLVEDRHDRPDHGLGNLLGHHHALGIRLDHVLGHDRLDQILYAGVGHDG